ncbi:hypothetical protein E3983_12725 [Legionella israelensis]|uniref:Coiled-coil protein n=1 Tax=Legionella israelensis TaxID=454 RepID=A0AAX1EJD5_9GAMM|nr:hypothetical protein [Legionella israelensis]QBR85139.1 hypothetical protein E3983_12725 [Legionella israelensis]
MNNKVINDQRELEWRRKYFENILLPDIEEKLGTLKNGIVGKTPDEDSIIKALEKQIPGVANIANRLRDTGSHTDAFIKEEILSHHIRGSAKAATAVGTGFSIASLVFYAFEFFRIPGIYLASFILGRKVPFTLKNNAKWLYSAVLLGLSIAAIAVPGVAPFLAIGISALAVGVGLFTVGRFFYRKRQIKKELSKQNEEIEKVENDIDKLRQAKIEDTLNYKFSNENIENAIKDMRKAKEDLDALKSKNATEEEIKEAGKKLESSQNKLISLYFKARRDKASTPKELDAMFEEMEEFQKKLQTNMEHLQNLKDKVAELEKENEEMGLMSVVDKGVGTILGAAALGGLVVSLFFPPIGAGILLGVSAAALTYASARLATPLFKKLGSWLVSKAKSIINKPEEEKEPAVKDVMNAPKPHKKIVPSDEVHESTADIFKTFFSENVVVALKKEICQTKHMEKIDRKLEALTKAQDHKGILEYFSNLAERFDRHQMGQRNVDFFLERLNNLQPGLRLLQQAFKSEDLKTDVTSIEKAQHILNNEVLKKALEEKGIDWSDVPVFEEKKASARISPAIKQKEEDSEGEREKGGDTLSTSHH